MFELYDKRKKVIKSSLKKLSKVDIAKLILRVGTGSRGKQSSCII